MAEALALVDDVDDARSVAAACLCTDWDFDVVPDGGRRVSIEARARARHTSAGPRTWRTADVVHVDLGAGTVLRSCRGDAASCNVVEDVARAASTVFEATVASLQRAASDRVAERRHWSTLLNEARTDVSARGRMATRVEDGLSQHLAGLRLTLPRARHDTCAGRGPRREPRGVPRHDAWIATWEHVVDAATDDARSLTAALRSAHRFPWLRASIAAVPTCLPIAIDLGLPDIASGTELVLARVAFEALDNVVRHARAQAVSVDAWATGEEVVMVVEDDGVGGDPRTFEGIDSGGLRRMRRWVSTCGGTIVVDASPRLGTRVHVRLPNVEPSVADGDDVARGRVHDATGRRP